MQSAKKLCIKMKNVREKTKKKWKKGIFILKKVGT